MPFPLRSISKKLLVALTLVLCLLYGLACISSFLPPSTYWYIAILGVGYAFLLAGLIGLLIFWVVIRSKWFILPLLTLLLSWKSINAFFAFHLMAPSVVTKQEGVIRIMQWNVERFGQMRPRNKQNRTLRKQIFAYIRIQDPDILCMQEFFESNDPKRFAENIPFFRDSLGFRYFYYAMDHRRPEVYEHGVAIFSKFPIKKTFRGKFEGPKEKKANESYIYADLNINGQMVRVMTTHLQSLLFSPDEFKNLEDIKKGDDSTFVKSVGIFRKFKQAYEFREQQANKVRKEIDKSPYPSIISGDFNDLPHSYVYNRIKGNYQDAFTKKGFGVGRTYSSISPTLRIDYTLLHPSFELVQCRNPNPQLSDHFPLITDFRLQDTSGISK
jgi:endonuclease/exonuclease/phosphatase family metal-dependent hydrolase